MRLAASDIAAAERAATKRGPARHALTPVKTAKTTSTKTKKA